MAETTKISWCDATFNPWLGCTKVSEGCKFCYAERDFDHRRKRVRWGPNGTRVITGDDNWKIPVKLNREAERFKSWSNWVRPRVFCASLSDVFEDWDGPILNNKGHELFWAHSREPHESPFKWIGDPECAGGETPVSLADVRSRLFKLIDATPNLDWLLLTKRPENIARMWREKDGRGWLDDMRPNVWLGTTVENQEQADKRIPELLKCRDLAPALFLSCEPLLGPVDLGRWTDRGLICSACAWQGTQATSNGLKHFEDSDPDDQEYQCPACGHPCGGQPLNERFDWVITGAESGPGARPSDLAWHESLVQQCKDDGVACFVKQLQLSGKLVTDVNAFPESLRVQEFPARRD